MSHVYYRNWTKMSRWEKVKKWSEKKMIKTPSFFGLFKMFESDTGGFPIGGGQNIYKPIESRIKKFLSKYPHAANYEMLTPMEPENYVQSLNHPMIKFLMRQEKYLSEGFSEEKSFELTEKELGEELQKEKYERSLFEGMATSNRSRSLMSYYDQKAEYESSQKVQQLVRDLGQYKRYQFDMEEKYKTILNMKDTETKLDVKPSNIKESKEEKNEKVYKYDPVTYKTSNMPDNDDKSQFSTQLNFASRSERLLDYFHSFSTIKDGISNLSDKEIILKANETPQKLKDSMNVLMKKLEKNNITLNNEGKIDYEKIKNDGLKNWIEKNERKITMCLLCKDLNFEIPHVVSKLNIKEKIMEELDEEQKRLEEMEDSKDKRLREEERLRLLKERVTYEKYFNILPNYNADIMVKEKKQISEGAYGNMKKYVKYEDFVKEFSNKYMFDNDLLYETYYYWENEEEKELRLRKLWLDSKKKKINLNEKLLSNELKNLNENIAELVRNLRRKIDQTLLKNKKHPIFGANYRFYKHNEFMLDSEIEFHKIKNFLRNSPEKIKNDPEIGFKYKELIHLLKRKKVEENTYVKFYDEKANSYYKPDVVQKEELPEEELYEDEKIPSVISEKINKYTHKAKNADKVEEELGKVKDQIVSQFENIIKEQNPGKKSAAKGSNKKSETKTKELKINPKTLNKKK